MAAKKITLGELATIVGAEVRGNANHLVQSITSIESASSDDVSFLSSKSYEKHLAGSHAGAVILKRESADLFSGNALIVDDPYLAYAKASVFFDPRPKRKQGIHATAIVAESAVISPTASIGANCVIGDNVSIGDNCEIYPGVVISEDSELGANCLIYSNVSIYSNVHIGNDVIIHSGTVIGSDGFGFAPTSDGWVKIHQIGGVRIGNGVEIGASVAIDRGAIGDTLIADGVIIDNQVHLAHNVEVGENTAIAGCTGVAGSAKIGKNCTIAGAVAINGHITIADNCHFHGGTIVTKGTQDAGAYASASPMLDVQKWRRCAVRYSQLDDIANRLKKLEKTQKS